MTPDLARRFGGVARLYGPAGAERIAGAHVAVIGMGGVGSWAAEALARSGVGELTLIDLDHVAESNVNRQIHALDETLGQAKVLAMAERIGRINPACVVHAVDAFVDAGNWPALLPAPVDAVLDACDQLRAKTTMAAWALRAGSAFVTVGAAGGKRQGERVEVGDLAQVTHDRLLAGLRYRLRREHGAPRQGRLGVACVFSRESMVLPLAGDLPAATDGSLSCHGYGSAVAVTATFGLCAAGWLLNHLSVEKTRT
ncbi:MAG: tRNA threonylcarbamoyladenosine dehydratase [Ottowia sp.]|nr:tRNA threonylcarbamoyladenosine dehydratase [Ottowia sp.]